MPLILLLLLFSSSFLPSGSGDDTATTAFIYASCSRSKYTLNSPYHLSLNSLLSSLTTSSTTTSYTNLTTTSLSGLFQCRGDLSATSCSNCITTSINQATSFCPFSTSAATQLSGCFLRYGNDSFVGKPDNSLVYKKCGDASNVALDAGFLGMRDAALAAVEGGNAGYRVGGAGFLQAMAQCVGDQSEMECDDCVSAAVVQLKTNCGFAVAGEVYLGKCYARFWSNGGYTGQQPSAKPNDNHSNETGKTIAIIIGVLAGIALLILFLSSLRKHGSDEKS